MVQGTYVRQQFIYESTASFSTSCYPHIVPMMNRWLIRKIKNSLFYTYMFFHLYLIINKNTEKGLSVCNPRTFLFKNLICYNLLQISCIPETTSQYPISQSDFPQISRIPVIFCANIPYPEKPQQDLLIESWPSHSDAKVDSQAIARCHFSC